MLILSDDERVLKLIRFMLHMGYNFATYPNPLDLMRKTHALVYIAQSFGYDLGYKFVYYIHGVYSTLLTKDLVHIRSVLK